MEILRKFVTRISNKVEGILLEVARRGPDNGIIGIDISSSMIEIAKKYAKREGIERRIRFEVISAYDLSFEDSYFDMVVSSVFYIILNIP